MSETITLIGETIPVVAQPWNRVASRLSKYQSQLSGNADVTVARLGAEAYEVLCVLAPEVSSRIPRYRWFGFESREAQDASDSEYGEGDGPTVPEVAEAFKTALRVNGGDAAAAVGKLVDPRMLQALISGAIEDQVRASSSTSRSRNGAQALTNGSPSEPRSESQSEAGQSLASVEPSKAEG